MNIKKQPPPQSAPPAPDPATVQTVTVLGRSGMRTRQSALIARCVWDQVTVQLVTARERGFDMPCPCCHNQTEVTFGRPNLSTYYRRRRCLSCGWLFSTTANNKRSPETIHIAPQSSRMAGQQQCEPFERWLTDDLPMSVHLGELRKAFERGVSREQAIREAGR